MASKEAQSIIDKIKGKTAVVEVEEDDAADDDMGGEATRAACEDMLKIALGREPKSSETDAWVEAMDSYFTAKGY